MSTEDTIRVAGEDRRLFVSPDVVDLRDRYYRPALLKLPQQVIPDPKDLEIRDQSRSSACTGFALASVIDRQARELFADATRGPVSTRMLFQMARLHDDLPDAGFAGSTLRGALKGFFHNGVCAEADAPFVPLPNAPVFALTMELADRAREVSLGAYYRLNHEINDYHTAINEAGAVIASAKIHSGWIRPKSGEIRPSTREEGRHAFAIVGYDKRGFLVQNSWGRRWSTLDCGDGTELKGVARWLYEDWFENVEDAWVLRLAISSPDAFRVKYARNHKVFRDAEVAGTPFVARRQDVIGHYLHIDDGEFVTRGRYAQEPADIMAMIKHLEAAANAKARDIDHVLFIAHGALQRAADVAARVKAWRDVFHANRIHPIHLMWETGFNNQVVNVVQDLLLKTGERMNKGDAHVDARLEELARPLGRKLWRDLKTTAQLSVHETTPAGQALTDILEATEPLKLHFLSQSAGVLLFTAFLPLLRKTGRALETVTLMAPACSVVHYEDSIRPELGQTVKAITQYNLIDKRELEDSLDVYGRSLLFLVSNAIETERPPNGEGGTPLLGLERHIARFALPPKHRVFHAGRDRRVTDSHTHRGFDSDRKTMNHLLETVLGGAPKSNVAFRDATLTGY